MKKIILLVVACLILSAGSVFAGAWSGANQVTMVYVNSNGTVYFQFGEMINPDSCASVSYIRLEPTHANRKEIYSLLLTAYMNGSNVRYFVSGCNGYPVLDHAYLNRGI